jgi:lipopolysaccharide transport system ATP-binding protein
MSEFVAKASIFVLASHSPDLMKQFCTRMIKLEHGKIVSDEPIEPDPPKDAAAAEPVREKTA